MFKSTDTLVSFNELDLKAVLSGLYCKESNIIDKTLEILLMNYLKISSILHSSPSRDTVIRKFITALSSYKYYSGCPELYANALFAMNLLLKKYSWIKSETGVLRIYKLLEQKRKLKPP